MFIKKSGNQYGISVISYPLRRVHQAISALLLFFADHGNASSSLSSKAILNLQGQVPSLLILAQSHQEQGLPVAAGGPEFADALFFTSIVPGGQMFSFVLQDQGSSVLEPGHEVRKKTTMGQGQPEGSGLPVHIADPPLNVRMGVQSYGAVVLLPAGLQVRDVRIEMLFKAIGAPVGRNRFGITGCRVRMGIGEAGLRPGIWGKQQTLVALGQCPGSGVVPAWPSGPQPKKG